MDVVLFVPQGRELCGAIPYWLDPDDPRPAREQLDSNYQHGGGWRPFNGFTMSKGGLIKYPGDPAHRPVAAMYLRDELIMVYRYGWVAIVQPDQSFEICRMD